MPVTSAPASWSSAARRNHHWISRYTEVEPLWKAQDISTFCPSVAVTFRGNSVNFAVKQRHNMLLPTNRLCSASCVVFFIVPSFPTTSPSYLNSLLIHLNFLFKHSFSSSEFPTHYLPCFFSHLVMFFLSYAEIHPLYTLNSAHGKCYRSPCLLP